MTLQTVKSPSTKIITCLRLKREKISGIVGPAIATPKANKLIKSPAWTIVTSKRSEMYGKIPMKPISVFKIPKTPTIKINISKFFLSISEAPVPYRA